MRFSVTTGILVYILATTRKTLSGSVKCASRADIHEDNLLPFRRYPNAASAAGVEAGLYGSVQQTRFFIPSEGSRLLQTFVRDCTGMFWRGSGRILSPFEELRPNSILKNNVDLLAVRAMMAGYFEGDIVLPETGSRSGSTEHPQMWLGGVIPYDVDSALASQKYFGAVKKAMADLEEKTCLRFVERTNESDYLHLISEQGCYSYVGRRGGQQPLSLGHGCLFVTTVAHELLHAAGFHHEHTRPDRDTYLNVMLDNVIPEYVNQFDKRNWSSVTVVSPFDKSSVMLYGSDAFAIDRNHLTILTKDNKRLPDVYMKTKISDWDFKRVNIYYEC